MSVGLFLLTFGLALRLTRLAVDDSITLPLRIKLTTASAGTWNRTTMTMDRTRRQKFVGWFAQLLDCPWCFGVWASAGSFAAAYFWGDHKWFVYVAAAMTASWLIGLASTYVYKVQSSY